MPNLRDASVLNKKLKSRQPTEWFDGSWLLCLGCYLHLRSLVVCHPGTSRFACRPGCCGNFSARSLRPAPESHQKCFFANAFPEPTFRYFSNTAALTSSSKRT